MAPLVLAGRSEGASTVWRGPFSIYQSASRTARATTSRLISIPERRRCVGCGDGTVRSLPVQGCACRQIVIADTPERVRERRCRLILRRLKQTKSFIHRCRLRAGREKAVTLRRAAPLSGLRLLASSGCGAARRAPACRPARGSGALVSPPVRLRSRPAMNNSSSHSCADSPAANDGGVRCEHRLEGADSEQIGIHTWSRDQGSAEDLCGGIVVLDHALIPASQGTLWPCGMLARRWRDRCPE